jgi:hypothetical protein
MASEKNKYSVNPTGIKGGLQCGSMKELRQVQCLACKKIGLTCYAQCRRCGVHHEVQVLE